MKMRRPSPYFLFVYLKYPTCSITLRFSTRNTPQKMGISSSLRMITASEAERFGLINRAVEPDRLAEQTLAMARTIASKSALTVKTGKEAFYRQREMALSDAYDYAATVMVENMLARDAEEGIGAFLEKRPPRWEDR